MREIKFRAWHESEKEMIPNCNQGFEGDVFNWKHQGQPIQIMQFTGLQDKNGVDIYEGDVCTYEENVADYHFIIIKVVAAMDGEFLSTCDWHLDIEVIGNIHQNPELLEVTK